MTTAQVSTGASANAARTGLYLAVLQLVFTLGWTTYVVYLPRLAADVGLAPAVVIFILMLDQAIFTIADTAMGIAADRIAPVVGRLGLFVGVLAAISCAAFVALPFVAGIGAGAQVGLIALIVVWSVTSSALRAPPLTLLGKYRARPQVPFLAALAMLGYGLAGAVSPYLGVMLRAHDARLPFVISGAVLLLTALGLSRIEYDVARDTSPPTPAEAAKPLGLVPIAFIVAMVALALGYQLHFAMNSAPFYLRFAKPDELQWLMPVFWIGFNIAMFPASLIVKHRGGLIVMGAAGLLGAVAIAAAELAGSLNTLIAAQFLAGAAWGCMLMSAISAALAIGSTGAEGKVTGLVFSALALGTFARMAAVAGGLQKMPEYAPLLHWAPVACWSVAGAGLLVIAAARLQGAPGLKASAGG
ncbi:MULTISPECIES: MFS transporter [Bradyrhizobium]|uniref:Blr2964 protein n=1 Tax=Bradyrhizobium diazoefficiens (strain JCM 10833 / BCRC 13528 / IAM 13628 / NBRC 14792 / USDA 110) TaxID=224911 RepID=Q89R08_BRADU|nr:MFS transporter [Bradyrhizobium diazoefficiens]MBP1067094.1 MFS family permease [Bradyrhizobium japonicum]AND88419.1 MFS transporter [Bradyrhizobium diazoefficiens USDA 110]AWO89973.1 MFS transporter [Bradyrhizobium diazoefficiens]PDT63384.1 MFS transporter [Bradyrhizobium diazoefficiens]QBP21787.1 MFS transporter [Bradyrhizobium diazoefficiens]